MNTLLKAAAAAAIGFAPISVAVSPVASAVCEIPPGAIMTPALMQAKAQCDAAAARAGYPVAPGATAPKPPTAPPPPAQPPPAPKPLTAPPPPSNALPPPNGVPCATPTCEQFGPPAPPPKPVGEPVTPGTNSITTPGGQPPPGALVANPTVMPGSQQETDIVNQVEHGPGYVYVDQEPAACQTPQTYAILQACDLAHANPLAGTTPPAGQPPAPPPGTVNHDPNLPNYTPTENLNSPPAQPDLNPVVGGISSGLGNAPGQAPPGAIPPDATQVAEGDGSGCAQPKNDGGYCDPNGHPNAWETLGLPKPKGSVNFDPTNPPMVNGIPQVDPNNPPPGFLTNGQPPAGWVMDGDNQYVPVAALQQRYGDDGVNNPHGYGLCETSSLGCPPGTVPVDGKKAVADTNKNNLGNCRMGIKDANGNPIPCGPAVNGTGQQ